MWREEKHLHHLRYGMEARKLWSYKWQIPYLLQYRVWKKQIENLMIQLEKPIGSI